MAIVIPSKHTYGNIENDKLADNAIKGVNSSYYKTSKTFDEIYNSSFDIYKITKNNNTYSAEYVDVNNSGMTVIEEYSKTFIRTVLDGIMERVVANYTVEIGGRSQFIATSIDITPSDEEYVIYNDVTLSNVKRINGETQNIGSVSSYENFKQQVNAITSSFTQFSQWKSAYCGYEKIDDQHILVYIDYLKRFDFLAEGEYFVRPNYNTVIKAFVLHTSQENMSVGESDDFALQTNELFQDGTGTKQSVNVNVNIVNNGQYFSYFTIDSALDYDLYINARGVSGSSTRNIVSVIRKGNLRSSANIYLLPYSYTITDRYRIIDVNTFWSNAIIYNYEKGLEKATIRCALENYYDTNGNLVKSITDSTKDMFFAIGEEVIPYVNRVNGDEPLSRYESFTKKFRIQNIKLINDGAIWQELDLLESGIIGVSSYNITITQGANTTLIVTRTSSPYQHAQLGTLTSGNTIYYGDVLTVSVNASSGFTASYSGFVSGSSVDGAVNIISVATPNTYTLTLNQGTGSILTVKRTSSPYKHAQTGTLYNGNEIYFGDILTVSVSAQSGYENPTYSGFVSGSGVSGNVTITSSADVHIPSWHTMWSGTKTLQYEDDYETQTARFTVGEQFGLSDIGISDRTLPIRITGSHSLTMSGVGKTNNFVNLEVSQGSLVAIMTDRIVGKADYEVRCGRLLNSLNFIDYITPTQSFTGTLVYTIKLTKVEQYY